MIFGKMGFNKPTPQTINNIVHGASAVFAILTATISQDPHIPSLFKEEFSLWGGSFVAISQIVRPFFGVNISSPTVPTENVSAVETNKDTPPLPYNKTNQ